MNSIASLNLMVEFNSFVNFKKYNFQFNTNKTFVTFTSFYLLFLMESVNLRFVVEKFKRPTQIQKRGREHFCRSDFSCDPWLGKGSSVLRCLQINSSDRFREPDS